MSYVGLMIQSTGAINKNRVSSYDEDENTSNCKHLFSGDAITVATPCDLY